MQTVKMWSEEIAERAEWAESQGLEVEVSHHNGIILNAIIDGRVFISYEAEEADNV